MKAVEIWQLACCGLRRCLTLHPCFVPMPMHPAAAPSKSNSLNSRPEPATGAVRSLVPVFASFTPAAIRQATCLQAVAGLNTCLPLFVW